MQAAIKIEKKVPMPHVIGKGRPKWLPIFDAMKPGDSFAVPSFREVNSASTSFYRWRGLDKGRNELRLSQRMQADGSYRIWLVNA